MTAPGPGDSTSTQEGGAPASVEDARTGVRGGDPNRMDAAPGSGGVPAAGADGQTAAREQLRKDRGERPADAGGEEGSDLAQAEALGQTDDPSSGSLTGG